MLIKFAAAQVIEAKVANQGGGLLKDAHRHSFDYDPRPGYLYVRSRAISSRINDNYDEFPADEIKEAYQSFIGKPVFVNHHNDNHRRARGVIVDAALHEDKIPKTGELDTWVEVLMEVDAIKFPKLAQAILAGEIDRTSMGCDVKASQCSACGNWAETPLQYCAHIPAQKGLKIRRKTASGEPEDVLVYEKCVGLSFFENSLLVEEPADPTAYFLGVDDRGLQMAAKKQAKFAKTAQGEVRVPGQVDTLRDDDCPVCGEHDSFDGDVCMVCEYKRPPDEFLDPDLEMAQQVDLRQEEEAVPEQIGMDPNPETGQPDPMAADQGLEPGVDENGLPIEGEEEVLGDDELSDELGEQPLPDSDDMTEADEEAADEILGDPEADGDPDAEGDEASQGEEQGEPTTDEEPTLDGVAEDAQDGDLAGDDKSDSPIDVNADPDSIVADDDVEEDFSDEFNVQEGQTPTQGVESDDESDDDDEDDFKKKTHKSGDIAMRPTLEILAKQQGQINSVSKAILELARAAGVEKRPAFAALRKAAEDENPAQAEGWANPEGEGGATEAPVATSEETLGDVDNEDRAGGSPDTPEVKGTEGDPNTAKRRAQQAARRRKAELEDVEEIGDTSENDTAPDAMEDLEGGSTVLDEPLDLNEVDVTEPVAGTEDLDEGSRGQAGSGRTETEVRVDESADGANNPEPAFDYDEGGWDKESASEGRTIAALRLARLRLQAGIEGGDDLEIGTKIARSKMTNQSIQAEIEILAKVVTAQAVNQKKATRRPRGLVPRSTAKVERTVPSLSAPQPRVAYAVSEDEFLFE